jgi:ribosomal protein S18 acetylase RimI-like enzyme
MPEFKLRQATRADLEHCCAIAEQTMRAYVEQTWGAWDSVAQDQRVRDYFNEQTHQMIVQEDQIIGLLVIEVEETHVLLAKIYLLANFQNQGIGASIIRHALSVAVKQGKTLRLRVLKANHRAKKFYDREGLTVYDQSETHWMMESHLPLKL